MDKLGWLARYARDEDAQSLVEFALTLPIFLLVVTGLFDVSRAVWQSNTLAFATREGTRYAIVHGSAGVPPVGPCSTHPCRSRGAEFTSRSLRNTEDAGVDSVPGVRSTTCDTHYRSVTTRRANHT